MIRHTGRLALCSALALTVTGGAFAQQGRVRYVEYELPQGAVLKAKLDQKLNSAEARKGDRFTGTVQPDEDGSGLPRGTRIEGVVREAKAASDDRPGVLDVEFTALRFPDGNTRQVSGSLTSLDSKSVERSESGRLVAKEQKRNDRVKWLGYGAGAGAVVGLLTGSNLIKSTLIGAAGGFLYNELQKDKERDGRYSNVNLKEGAEFGVRLDQDFTWVPVAARTTNRYGEPIGHNPPSYGGTPRPSGIGVFMDDRQVSFANARPFRAGNTVMVPINPVVSAAGRRISYNEKTRQISVIGGRGPVRTTVGSYMAWGPGRSVRLPLPARYFRGTLYVPVQFLELATGRQSEWDERDQTVLFFSPGSGAPAARERNTTL